MKKKKRTFGVLSAVMLTMTMLFSVTVNAASPVTSPVPLNGATAEGTCGYTTTYATATTRHPVSSTKKVQVYAYVYYGGYFQMGYGHNEGTGSTPVTADAYPGNSVAILVGAKGVHYVKAGTLTWEDISAVGWTV